MIVNRQCRLGMLVLAMGAVVATSSYSQDAQDWDKVVDAAKKEGKVVVYSGFVGGPETPIVAAMFEQRYGIPVQVIAGRPSEMQERIRTEVSTGRPNGDVSLNGGNSQVLMQKAGLLQLPGHVPAAAKLTIEPTVPEEIPVYVSSYGLVINTNLVPKGQEPRSWLDLLDPKWKGKILSDEMGTTGAAATWFSVIQEKFGTDFHRKFATQNIQFSNVIVENPRRIARGEFAIYVPFIMTTILTLDGLPVKAVVPEEGSPYSVFSVALIKGAVRTNAARLFMNFMLEPDVQQIYANNGYVVATKLERDLPAKLGWAKDQKLLGRQSVDGVQERMKQAKEIYSAR